MPYAGRQWLRQSSACPRCWGQCRDCPSDPLSRHRLMRHSASSRSASARRVRHRCGIAQISSLRGRDKLGHPLTLRSRHRRNPLCRAMPRSNRSRCSGRLDARNQHVQVVNFLRRVDLGEEAADKKSAFCFWLSPSRTTLSPGASRVSRASTILSVARRRPVVMIGKTAETPRFLGSARRPAALRSGTWRGSIHVRPLFLGAVPCDPPSVACRSYAIMRFDGSPVGVW